MQRGRAIRQIYEYKLIESLLETISSAKWTLMKLFSSLVCISILFPYFLISILARHVVCHVISMNFDERIEDLSPTENFFVFCDVIETPRVIHA